MPLKSGFRALTSIEGALNIFLNSFPPLSRVEILPLEDAGERVLASDIKAPRDVPHYDRSAMDGYAVIAADTFGSGKDAGAMLRLTTKDAIESGECRQVHTGSPMPEGADAVIMLEYVEAVGDSIEALAQVSPGQNVGRRGEDVRKGDVVFPEGRQLKPSDVGLLASMGFTEVSVYAKPRVLIIPTGEEIVPRGEEPVAGQMNESNGVMNYLYVKRFGGIPTVHSIVSDKKDELSAALREGAAYDLIVTTGGSSVGRRDLIAEVLGASGEVLVHGVAIKPGKPVALGLVRMNDKKTPIVCLPGYPAACAVDSMVFVDPAVKRLGHLPPPAYRTQKAVLTRKIFSEAGYRTYTRVSIEDGRATPMRTKGAGILSSISHADGYVVTPEDTEGREAGEEVEVAFLE
ncbi:MAG TPA: gephyrin-like molybdotransferase Glp [Methanocella sp.]|uniref:molybdopterin molybdotransferase MoeA n=1 Tax=Methanocella sp. TaxID=2052833 RepID=UPI002B9C26EF|nr:gephyrin-like molybdotransferase Glp [Methanocella sp.]HTY91436.1 gephyrin-like molybdotransferase Glp [Methanocella sp.]